ncbi:MAG: GGDEF domain-containing protein, partial [Candidatus Eremiobacteraeota bacterium]|nr:GGDEF domain-containing protein [Candidatus Eremiobacteraeota bacterium]
ITALHDADGTLYGYGKITRDLTERRTYERQLEHMADHDPLTGVGNRRRFGRELNGHVSRMARYGADGALLMLDLDHFKSFNDTQGHSEGDRLMVRIAHGLESRLRDSDVFARLGGDEFAVLLPFADEGATIAVAEALLQVVRDQAMPAVIGVQKWVTASVGIALFTDGECLSAEQMMANADLAMYDAKDAGRNRWARYRIVAR